MSTNLFSFLDKLNMYWLILVVFCLIFIFTLFYNINPYLNIPGLTIAEMFHFIYKCKRTDVLKGFNKFFHTYGPIYKTWLGWNYNVHIGSADDAQKILCCTVNVEKPNIFRFSKVWVGESLPISKRELWYKRRKLLSPAFNFNVLQEYICVMVKHFQIFTDTLEKEIDSEEFNILPYITTSAMNTIGETTMNMNMNAGNGISQTYARNIHRIEKLIFKRACSPFLHFDIIHAFSKNYRKTLNASKELHKISHQIINENLSRRQERRILRQKETNVRDDEMDPDRRECKTYLDILLDKYEEGDKSLTMEDIREEVDAIFYAGYDTATTTIGFTIFLVGHHPEVQDKIHAELDSLLPTEDTPVNAKTLAKMNFLECVIKESLRFYPVAPMILRCLTQPVNLDKHTLPAGTQIFIHIHRIHRSPEHYLNPDKFDPSNFFPDKAEKRHPLAYIPFSAGPRNCIGQKYGKLETKVALALFFKKYKVESTMKMEDLKLISEVVLRPMNGIMVKIKKRC